MKLQTLMIYFLGAHLVILHQKKNSRGKFCQNSLILEEEKKSAILTFF
jgi:hypothetical protein